MNPVSLLIFHELEITIYMLDRSLILGNRSENLLTKKNKSEWKLTPNLSETKMRKLSMQLELIK